MARIGTAGRAGSSAVPEAAARSGCIPKGCPRPRPGEERHLTPNVLRYAQRLLGGGCFSPTRLPHGECGVRGRAPRFIVQCTANPRHANSGDSNESNIVNVGELRFSKEKPREAGQPTLGYLFLTAIRGQQCQFYLSLGRLVHLSPSATI